LVDNQRTLVFAGSLVIRTVQGYDEFRQRYFPRHAEEYIRSVKQGQHPSTLFIGCMYVVCG